MNTWYWIILCVVLFLMAFWLGIFCISLMKTGRDYDGTIFVTRTEDKITYTLDLNESPEVFEFMPELLFKVTRVEVEKMEDSD